MNVNEIMNFFNNAKKEWFRLQLLNEYVVEQEKDAFLAYKRGERPRSSKGSESWRKFIEDKTNNGIKYITIHVVDLPISEYMGFGIQTVYEVTKLIGQEVFFVERSKVKSLISGVKDYWMFDNNTVIYADYDESSHFIEFKNPIYQKDVVTTLVTLKEELLKKAIPLDEFIKEERTGFKEHKLL